MSQIEIFQGSCFTLPSSFASNFDALITDPPYSEHVHTAAVTKGSSRTERGVRKRDLGFESLSRKGRVYVAECAAQVKRWSLVYSDLESFNALALCAQARGAEYVRMVPWVRWSMPQLSGDRPPSGAEAVVILHHAERGKPVRKHWNGPGTFSHFDEKCMRGDRKHKTQKKLSQLLRIVSYFTEPGETVYDPFGGSGTTAQACRILDRNCVSFELDRAWAERANDRVTAPLDAQDRAELIEWLSRDDEPAAQQAEGPSVIRAQNRANDKARARHWLGA